MPANSGTRRLSVEVGYSNRDVVRGVPQTTSLIRGLVNEIKDIGTAFGQAQSGIFFFTNNLQSLANTALGAFRQVEEGARRLELREAFASQIGGAEQEVVAFLDRLNQASGNTINEFDLIASASKSMSLGVTSDVDQMAQLLEVARFKARKFGIDTSTAFNDIVTGIGRVSPLILDNLGIVFDANTAYREYADSVGRSVDSLTEAEKKQILLNEVLRTGAAEIQAAGGIYDTQADKLRQIQVEYDKALAAAQKYFAFTAGRALTGGGGQANQVETFFNDQALRDLRDLGTSEIFNQTGDLFGVISLNVKNATGDLQGFYEQLGQNAEQQRIFNQVLIENAAAFGVSQEALQQELGITTEQLVLAGDGARVAKIGFDDATASSQVLALQQLATADATQALNIVFDQLVGISGSVSGALGAITNDAIGLSGGMNAALNGVINLTNGLLQLAGVESSISFLNKGGRGLSLNQTGGGVKNVVGGRVQVFRATEAAATRAYRGVSTAATSAARAQEKAFKDAAAAAEREYNRIGGFVDSALSFDGSVNADDFLLDKFGLRNQNASNELIRQLQDVADRASEGIRSRFLDENPLFAFLDDANLERVRANAIATIRSIKEEGKYFELIPFDQFLQDVRELEEAERRRQEFRDRAIQALGAGSTAAVDKALGIENAGTQTGEIMAANITATLEAGIEAEQARFRAMGELGAQYFEGGFNQGLRGIVRRMLEQELDAMTQEIAA